MSAARGESRDGGSRSVFDGLGIQHSGSGNFNARDIHIGTTLDRDYDQDQDQLLADLRVTDPRDDKKRIEATKGGLLENSYRWILEHRDFLQWRTDSQSRMLWIKGDPGKGKTMLLCGIINELEKTSPTQPAYFFCQATDDRLNSATAVLRGLLYMLVYQHPPLATYLRDKYKHAGKRLFEDINAWFAMSDVLTSILADPALDGKVLVIDALDECVTDIQQLLDFISTTSSCVKWIVSSRNWPSIEQTLNDTTAKVSLCLELNADSIATAVQAYIHSKVGELALLNGYDDPTRDAVQKHFMDNSNDTFLWVALVCEQLKTVDAWEAADAVKEIPAGLKDLYRRMMQKILQLGRRDPELCRSVLLTVTTAFRPLYLMELAELSNLPSNFPRTKASVMKIVSKCGSFLTIRDDVVYTIHQSARDFLASDTHVFPTGVEAEHYTIFSKTLQVLTSQLKRDIYSLHEPGVLIEEISPPDPDPLAPLRYACIYWVDHLRDSNPTKSPGRRDIQDNDRVHDFLKTKFLYWLEALSLLRSMSQGVLAVQTLEALVTSAARSQLAMLVQDAHRFSQSHGVIVGAAPLQVYLSALVFSPRNSIIRQLYEYEARAWIAAMPDMEANWNACVQTLEGHGGTVMSVVCLADGRRLASGSYDETVKIWDTATGACLQTLKGHSYMVLSVASSPDGRRLASGSGDKTIKIWDTVTGVCIQTLEGHGGMVSSVAFPADGQWLASGSYDNTAKIWDTATGACVQTFKGHGGPVLSVAISVDGLWLASGSYDKTIKIWDTVTGVCVQTLEGHDSWVSSVAFSPDGRWLASGSEDKTIKIWDIATGACTQSLKGHKRKVLSVTFSADGLWLASGSYDKTVKIWDIMTGACVRNREGHNDWVSSVAFIADGRRLVSGSYDMTAKIWDRVTGACIQTLGGHDDAVSSIAFSPDGRRLVSGSYDMTAKIWDRVTGACIQTLGGHDDAVSSIAFSPDGRQLVSGSFYLIKIWDIATGACAQTLEGHNDTVSSIAFSPDGRRLVSGSYGMAKIWDLATGLCIQTIKGRDREVLSVDFSADGRQVVSGSYGKIKIWDIATGLCIQILDGRDREVLSVSVDFSADGRQVTTNRGILSLDMSALESQGPKSPTKEPYYHGYSIGPGKTWILKDGKRLLWLPLDYRPENSAVTRSTVALGCRSGRALCMTFSGSQAGT